MQRGRTTVGRCCAAGQAALPVPAAASACGCLLCHVLPMRGRAGAGPAEGIRGGPSHFRFRRSVFCSAACCGRGWWSGHRVPQNHSFSK